MELLPLAFLAGILTVLSPCVLPLLPVVLAGSAAEENRRAPYIIIASLAVSVVLFTLLIKATTVLLGVPSNVWLIISGALVAFIGASLAFPRIWDRLAEGLKLHEASGRLSAGTATRTGTSRNVLLGFSLGPAFTSCSPTYGLILAAVLPANFTVGLSNLAAYTVGLAAVLLLVALGGRKVTKRLGWATNPNGRFRRGLGVFLVLVGLLIASGQIRTIETWLIDRGFLGTVALERGFIDSAQGQQGTGSTGSTDGGGTDVANVPNFLRQSFPTTDFSRADPAIANVLSGGPAKDGIPALDNPAFVPVSEFTRPDSVQALLLEGSTEIKAYPYNILVWHEIVNDTIDGEPVAVTFCPLCGSAIVYEGVLPGGEATTFGVSGALLESNLVMFDRSTETLWQQSTGKALAGTHFGQQLALHKFQLLSVGEIKAPAPLGDNPQRKYRPPARLRLQPLRRLRPGRPVHLPSQLQRSPVLRQGHLRRLHRGRHPGGRALAGPGERPELHHRRRRQDRHADQGRQQPGDHRTGQHHDPVLLRDVVQLGGPAPGRGCGLRPADGIARRDRLLRFS
nr:DUF3179 domain-containing (seleno)protein [Arthrobacter sp. PAMC25284]